MPPSSITAEAIITLLTEQEILPEAEKIEAESDLFALGLDSLATMQLLLHLERQFLVSIPHEQISHQNLSTPAHLAAWLQQLVA
jgi:acyl carrier protein